MLYTHDLYGAIQCLSDDASCVLDGESSRRVMYVYGTGSGKLTIRAIRFYKGKYSRGGGVYINNDAKVDITLCVFDSCEATYTSSNYGGGGIYVSSSGDTVNIYATTFTANSVSNGNRDDIRNPSDGTVTIHGTCPSPYSANTPTQGKYENSIPPSKHNIKMLMIILTWVHFFLTPFLFQFNPIFLSQALLSTPTGLSEVQNTPTFAFLGIEVLGISCL